MIGIDLGSNTLRACKMDESGEILWDFERIVGSARNMDENGLANDAKSRILNALNELKNERDLKGRYFGVATAAFRKAKNAKEFLGKINQEVGICFEIISGELEGKLANMGIKNRLNALGILDENALFMDIGGASTELCFKGDIKSFDFGIVSFANIFGQDFSAAKQVCADACEFISKIKPEIVVLSSGVPTSIAALKIGLNYANYDAKLINGMRLELADFDAAAQKIIASDDKDALVGKNRSDIMLCGIALSKELLNGINAPFVAIDDGLREGICAGVFKGILDSKVFK